MNRNNEFSELIGELEETPLKLDFTLERARLKLKEKKRRVRKAVFAPLGTAAAVFAIFVLLVNVSPTFAYAAGRVPLLRELAKFVAVSPSLSAAVENEYVQPMGLEQTADGVTARIEYVIVDQKQLNIFYTMSSNSYEHLTADPDISSADGSELEGFSVVFNDPGETNEKLHKITVDFPEGTMPDALKVTLRVIKSLASETGETGAPAKESSPESLYFPENEAKPETITEISFTLRFDSAYTATGEITTLNQKFILDSQKLTLQTAEIYPTHMRIVFDDDESDTAWMTGLEFYVENENGEHFEGISNGVSAYGKKDSPMQQQFMLESPFFSNSKHLTLYITGVTWLDKDMEKVHINLKNKTAEALPEGVRFVSSEKYYSDWLLRFTATALKENYSQQVWGSYYYDAQGKRYEINAFTFTSVGSSYQEGISDEAVKNQFSINLPLKDYPYDEVWLSPAYSRRVTLDAPLKIEIK